MDTKALLFAVDYCGSQRELARRIGVAAPQLNEWCRGERPIPPDRCEQIELATGGAVTCEQLRPDLEWTRSDGRAFYRQRRETQEPARAA